MPGRTRVRQKAELSRPAARGEHEFDSCNARGCSMHQPCGLRCSACASRAGCTAQNSRLKPRAGARLHGPSRQQGCRRRDGSLVVFIRRRNDHQQWHRSVSWVWTRKRVNADKQPLLHGQCCDDRWRCIAAELFGTNRRAADKRRTMRFRGRAVRAVEIDVVGRKLSSWTKEVIQADP